MLVLRGPKRAVGSVDFSPDGTRLAAGDDDGTVWVFDVVAGKRLSFAAAEHGLLGRVAARFAPGGRHLVVGDERLRVGVWDAADGKLVRMLHAEVSRHSGVRGMQFTADGRLITAAFEQEMAAFDAATWEPRPPAIRSGDVRRASSNFAVEPGGARAALDTGGLIDLRTGEACGRWAQQIGATRAMAWCPGRPAVAALWYGPIITVFDTNAAAPLAHIKLAAVGHAIGLAFTPDGNTLITVGNDGVARYHDTNTWGERRALDWKVGPLRCVAVSPDGAQAAAGGGDSQRGEIVVWDLE